MIRALPLLLLLTGCGGLLGGSPPPVLMGLTPTQRVETGPAQTVAAK